MNTIASSIRSRPTNIRVLLVKIKNTFFSKRKRENKPVPKQTRNNFFPLSSNNVRIYIDRSIIYTKTKNNDTVQNTRTYQVIFISTAGKRFRRGSDQSVNMARLQSKIRWMLNVEQYMVQVSFPNERRYPTIGHTPQHAVIQELTNN